MGVWVWAIQFPEENTYTKTTGDLLVGDIVYTRADYESEFNGRGLSSMPTDISDSDIAKLADILGHSSINTTRIYIITTGSEHRRKIERLGLVI